MDEKGEALTETLSDEEKRLIRIRVQRRAARLVLTDAYFEGEVVRAKLYVDGIYTKHYVPEVLFFGPGYTCDDVIPCDFGMHRIEVIRETAKKYLCWKYSHDFQFEEDITKTPLLKECAPPEGKIEYVEYVDWDEFSAFVKIKAIYLVPGTSYNIEMRSVPTGYHSNFHFIPIEDTYTHTIGIPWSAIDFGDCTIDVLLLKGTEILAEANVYIPLKPPPLKGTVDIENSIFPDSIFLGEPAEFIIRVINLTEGDFAVQFRETLEFRGVTIEKDYAYKSKWGKTISGEGATDDLSVTVKLPKAAIHKDKLWEDYDIYSILEARVGKGGGGEEEEEEEEVPALTIVSAAIDPAAGKPGDNITVAMILRNPSGKDFIATIGGSINGADLPTEKTATLIGGQDTEIRYRFALPEISTGAKTIIVGVGGATEAVDTHAFPFTVT